MKTCPTCQRTFEDTFTFCLVDGSILSAPYDPHETLRIPAPRSTDPAPTEDGVWGPIQQASINQGDGQMMTYYRGTTPEQCRADCEVKPRCKAYTYIKAGAYNPNDPPMCYLMSEARKLTPSPCCISAIKN